MRNKFTPALANKMLPLVRRIVSDILEHGQVLKQLGDRPGAPSRHLREIDQHKEELAQLLAELEGLGCFYKGWSLDVGLVDFPAVIEGSEVLLCWKSDEANVKYYHDYEQGFAGRRPIPAHLLESHEPSTET